MGTAATGALPRRRYAGVHGRDARRKLEVETAQELRSSRRKEAHSISGEGSLLTSAATVWIRVFALTPLFRDSPIQLVDLCRQDEIAFTQAVDLVCPESDFHSSPRQGDVRMVFV